MELKFGVAYTQDSCTACVPTRNSAGGSGGDTPSDPVEWNDIEDKPPTLEYEWIVGDPAYAAYPGSGAVEYQNTNFANAAFSRIKVERNYQPQSKIARGDGYTWITKASTESDKIGFAPALAAGETIKVTIAPL
jgi:hypothetical protein